MQIKSRSHLIQFLHKHCMEQLRKAKQIRQKQKMGELALENQLLISAVSPTFYFNYRWFHHPWEISLPTRKRGLNKKLDISLRPKATSILQVHSYSNQVENTLLRNYVGNCLTSCKTFACLEKLLSIELAENEFIRSTYENYFNVGDPLTETELTAFKEKNKKGLEVFKKLSMMNFIMGTN